MSTIGICLSIGKTLEIKGNSSATSNKKNLSSKELRLRFFVFLGANSSHPLYLCLLKESSQRMPFLSGLGQLFPQDIYFKKLYLDY